jgi:2-C-methyl-D-erythritol 4-phosphate cytidylyltransferase
MKEKVIGIILAGGVGKRMGTRTPKQFLKLSGKPIILYSLLAFEKSDVIDKIVVVCNKDHAKRLNNLVRASKLKKVYKIVPGGSTRQRSSFNGIKVCPADTKYVLIHDAARPFVTGKLIKDVLEATVRCGAAAPAIDPSDTVVVQEEGLIRNIPDRRTIKMIQTPQGFCYARILDAHKKARDNGTYNFTDDLGLVKALKFKAETTKGSRKNLKVTDKSDLLVLKALL